MLNLVLDYDFKPLVRISLNHQTIIGHQII